MSVKFLSGCVVLVVSLFSSLAKAETTELVHFPVHAESHLPLSFRSDEDGVCKYLHYSRAVHNSMKKEWYWGERGAFLYEGNNRPYHDVLKVRRDEAIVLGSEGQILEQVNSKTIGIITCIRD